VERRDQIDHGEPLGMACFFEHVPQERKWVGVSARYFVELAEIDHHSEVSTLLWDEEDVAGRGGLGSSDHSFFEEFVDFNIHGSIFG
jgi:hypothetical protein